MEDFSCFRSSNFISVSRDSPNNRLPTTGQHSCPYSPVTGLFKTWPATKSLFKLSLQLQYTQFHSCWAKDHSLQLTTNLTKIFGVSDSSLSSLVCYLKTYLSQPRSRQEPLVFQFQLSLNFGCLIVAVIFSCLRSK